MKLGLISSFQYLDLLYIIEIQIPSRPHNSRHQYPHPLRRQSISRANFYSLLPNKAHFSIS